MSGTGHLYCEAESSQRGVADVSRLANVHQILSRCIETGYLKSRQFLVAIHGVGFHLESLNGVDGVNLPRLDGKTAGDLMARLAAHLSRTGRAVVFSLEAIQPHRPPASGFLLAWPWWPHGTKPPTAGYMAAA